MESQTFGFFITIRNDSSLLNIGRMFNGLILCIRFGDNIRPGRIAQGGVAVVQSGNRADGLLLPEGWVCQVVDAALFILLVHLGELQLELFEGYLKVGGGF